MAIFSSGGITSPDVYIGITSILLGLLCTVLNPLVFVHNYRKKSSLARNLYLVMSTMDFLTTWTVLFPFAARVLVEKDAKCQENSDLSCNEEYWKRNRDANLWEMLFAPLTLLLLVAPTNVSSILAITRHLQIKYPFRPTSSMKVFGLLFLSFVWILTTSSVVVFNSTNKPITTQFIGIASQNSIQITGVCISKLGYYSIIFSVTIMLQIISVVTSVLTIHELVNTADLVSSRSTSKRRSSIRILVTNFGNIVMAVVMCSMILLARPSENPNLLQAIITIIGVILCPCLMSTLNPAIYLCFISECSRSKRKIGPVLDL